MTEVMDTAGIEPGFANPVFDCQDTFRRILDAYAYVGRIQHLSSEVSAIGPLGPAAISICLTLADFDTPTWLDPASDQKSVRNFLGFHCGVPFTRGIEQSTFAVVTNPAMMPRLTHFSLGTELEPQRSTTVLIEVPSFTGGPAVRWSGPGIQHDIAMAIDGLPAWFWEEWQGNHELYPLGIDVLFACDRAVVALPRSISVEF
ncbi:phosphonate C-P lyase system protein PhnH (plasmid) [Sinorhizobium meliloti]|uniref:phosphonate C-P lyase system protein PhnH n=1 Tax=Rhizobium meliloti TaxID=382 RepID=UPI000B49AB1E|nr:phosphonate C-P lyase system protein PhnH [Sinorhizobium meliloti]ASP89686.1 phosphonate C-P lyase system protein PhnH [Sinorhizobium meliloti]MQW25550.1 phosphonate C-P lyase system protein PhnH [Sinorhizobium meliloti]